MPPRPAVASLFRRAQCRVHLAHHFCLSPSTPSPGFHLSRSRGTLLARPIPSLPRRGPSSPSEVLFADGYGTAEGNVATTTARSRANIFDLYKRFARANHPSGCDALVEPTVLAFLQQMVDERVPSGQSLAGVANYARYLRARMQEARQDTLSLQRFIVALDLRGALVPHRQATPITRAELAELKDLLPAKSWIAVWLAWKTASRLGEVLQLTGTHILPQPGGEIVIQWLQTTKAGRKRPYALSNLTELAPTPFDTAEFEALRALRPADKVCDLTTTAVVRQIHAAGLRQITGHSMKRGAILLLSRLVASDLIGPEVLVTLAKHSSKVPTLPDVTVRYGADKAAMARIGGTREDTSHL